MEAKEKQQKDLSVLFDPQIFLLQHHGGISKYFSEIIRIFRENPSLGIIPIIEYKYVFSAHALESLSAFNVMPLRRKVMAVAHLISLTLIRNSVRSDFQLVHQTFYLPGFLGRHKKLPHVVTLHDMIPENTGSKLRLWNPHFIKKKFLISADLLLSVSNSSTEDMRKKYRLTKPVTTTYLGVSSDFQPNPTNLNAFPEPYFLFVGKRGGYKNFATALGAFSKIARTHKSVSFRLVGGGKLSFAERKLVMKLGVSARVEQLQVSSSDLPRLYSNAIALLYPSKYEGFGLPLVEAMASGIPILASDTPINREICENAGVFFDPENQDQLFSYMQLLLTKPNVFSDKVELGLERASEFTWYKCAEKTALAYRSLLQNNLEI
jgi:glycosyltransferase involved in cell wall biosynthesis